MANRFWKRFFSFVVSSLVATLILIGISYVAMGAKIGSGALANINSWELEFWREDWFNNFSWLHYAFQGMMLATFNLLIKRRDEAVHIAWYVDGISQMFGVVKLMVSFLVLESLAYLTQFIANAIFIAVTNWVSEVTVPNLVSLEYLASKIDILLIIWEALLSALIISFFDRKRRREKAEEEEMEKRMRRNETDNASRRRAK